LHIQSALNWLQSLMEGLDLESCDNLLHFLNQVFQCLVAIPDEGGLERVFIIINC